MKAALNLPLAFWIVYPLASVAWAATVTAETAVSAHSLPTLFALVYLYRHHLRNRPDVSRWPRLRAFEMAWLSLLLVQLVFALGLAAVLLVAGTY